MDRQTARVPFKHRKTCMRLNEPGQAHALTFSCFRRQPSLARDRTRTWMLDAIDLARANHRFDLWAYVIMPEHVHLLIYPTQKMYDISKILTTLKQPMAKKATLLVQREAPGFAGRMTDRQPNGKVSLRFWDRGGGYDRNLWSPAYVWETIDYIHHNPVRRGLCDSPVDWHGSSAVAYHSDEECPLALDLHSLPDDPRSAVR